LQTPSYETAGLVVVVAAAAAVIELGNNCFNVAESAKRDRQSIFNKDRWWCDRLTITDSEGNSSNPQPQITFPKNLLRARKSST
jgi:hypothetical protein